jgi:hypothetical protein
MGTRWDERVVLRAVADVFPPAAGKGYMAVDTRGLHDPASSRWLSGHAGTHGLILRRLTEHTAFHGLMERLQGSLAAAFNQQCPGMVVILLCKSGKHRSVGMGVLLRTCLAEDNRFRLEDMVHTTPLAQVVRCGMCTDCDFSRVDHDRQRAQASAFRLWREFRAREA